MKKTNFIKQLEPKLFGTLQKISKSNIVIKNVINKSNSLESFCNNLMAAIILEYDKDLKEKEKIKSMITQIVNNPFIKMK